MIQLFVKGQRVDLFKDENIEIQDSIQDAKDISKIFTTFSRTFTVPANKNNNNVFQNFYNFDVVNGFDPRKKVSSVITKNGATYRKGFIQIRKVKLEDNKPTSYTIFFTGLLSTLKDKLQDDRLSDLLELNNYNHPYTRSNVQKGFENIVEVDNGVLSSGEFTKNDLCYPFISVQERYGVDSSLNVKRINTDTNTITTDDLNYRDLKPAINAKRIIDAIESQYDITFSSSFLKQDSNFIDLFLWLNRNKGRLGTESKFNLKLFMLNFNNGFVSGDDFIASNFLSIFSNPENLATTPDFIYRFYDLIYNITATGKASADVKIVDANTSEQLAIEKFDFDNNTKSISHKLEFPVDIVDNRTYKPYLEIKTNESGISNLNIELNVTKRVKEDDTDNVDDPEITTDSTYEIDKTSVNDVDITAQIPKLKVIDFLTSIFKMFNLTAEVEDNIIKVLPLDEYYNQGKEINITKLVDISNSSVGKVDTIKRFNFSHKDATSLLLVERNKQFDSEYGNLEKELSDDDNKVLGGKSLNIQSDFYKILFENLRNANNDLSFIMSGWYVNEDREQLTNEPILFYANNVFLPSGSVTFQNGFIPEKYNESLNATQSESINFSDEFNERNFNLVEGLFKRYYSDYVNRVFSPQSRKVELEVILSDDFILNYKLNDKIIYKNRMYIINDIKINLNTNKAKLTLLNIPV